MRKQPKFRRLLSVALGFRSYQEFLAARMPRPLRDLRRNYDQMILGDACGRTTADDWPVDGTTLDLTNYQRNLYTDQLILQRFYSFLKKGGKACFGIDCGNRKALLDRSIAPIDYGFLHPVTLLEHGVDPHSAGYRLLQYTNGLRFWRARMAWPLRGKQCLAESEVWAVRSQIDSIRRFCTDRMLTPEFVFAHCQESLKQELRQGTGREAHFRFK